MHADGASLYRRFLCKLDLFFWGGGARVVGFSKTLQTKDKLVTAPNHSIEECARSNLLLYQKKHCLLEKTGEVCYI